jgi:hypothetical protein
MLITPLFIALVAAKTGSVHPFFHSFTTPDWQAAWVPTHAPNFTGNWTWDVSRAPQTIIGEHMLYAATPNAFHAISSRLKVPFDPTFHTLILQYELRFEAGFICSGGYVKLFGIDFDQTSLTNESTFLLMFGPDFCGDKKHRQFIFKQTNNFRSEDKSLINPPPAAADLLTNLYTLVIRPNNSFEIRTNDHKVRTGSLLTDFTPPVNRPAILDDPTDVRPSDWDDRRMTADPTQPKPEDWDESEAP